MPQGAAFGLKARLRGGELKTDGLPIADPSSSDNLVTWIQVSILHLCEASRALFMLSYWILFVAMRFCRMEA